MGIYRNPRLASLIEKELAKILIKEIEVKDVLITVTRVELSDDGLFARVKLGVFPIIKSLDVVKNLNKRSPYLRHLLLKALNIRRVPDLRFEIEEANFDKALSKIKDNK